MDSDTRSILIGFLMTAWVLVVKIFRIPQKYILGRKEDTNDE